MNAARSWRLASLPGVSRFRRIAERAFAPQLRADVAALQAHLDSLRGAHEEAAQRLGPLSETQDRLTDAVNAAHDDTRAALTELRDATDHFRATTARLETRMADVGDSVATSNALARKVQRELDRFASTDAKTSAAGESGEQDDRIS